MSNISIPNRKRPLQIFLNLKMADSLRDIHSLRKLIGRSVGRVWSFRDITQKKKAEQELISAKLKAEESDRLKTAFLHNVSHEIRTPMNAIIGFSSLLNEPDLHGSERQQYTEIIFQSSNQLLSIINDIVDVANIESGQVKVNMTKTDLNLSLRNLMNSSAIARNNIRFPLAFHPAFLMKKQLLLPITPNLFRYFPIL